MSLQCTKILHTCLAIFFYYIGPDSPYSCTAIAICSQIRDITNDELARELVNEPILCLRIPPKLALYFPKLILNSFFLCPVILI